MHGRSIWSVMITVRCIVDVRPLWKGEVLLPTTPAENDGVIMDAMHDIYYLRHLQRNSEERSQLA